VTQAELITLITQEIKKLASKVTVTDYTNATNDASRELGWSFPVTGGFKELWIKKRSKRHLFYYLLTERADKFKFEQINLQHKFEHFLTLIKEMDAEFKEAVEENPVEFADVSLLNLFGTKFDAGFSYEDGTGVDTTYMDSNLVILTPTETD